MRPLLSIYTLIDFQWYKKLFNPLGFDPYHFYLKIHESTGTPNSQSGSSFGNVKVHSLTFSFTLGLPFGPQPCKPFTLVVSSRLGLRHLMQIGYDLLSLLFFNVGSKESFNKLYKHLLIGWKNWINICICIWFW